MISLAVFLGNYGRQYACNRHNAAWFFADWLFASSDFLPFASDLTWQRKFRGVYASLDPMRLAEKAQKSLSAAASPDGGGPIHPSENLPPRFCFLKPETFMNLSGESIGEIARFYRILPEEILVIHDELELPPGTVSLKWSGGLGGHNGLRSAKAVLGTADFWRLRIGIGRPDHGDVAGYVLSDFTGDEKILLSQIFPAVSDLFVRVLLEGPQGYLKGWAKKKLA
ncbi:MAG: aminoacyl-tRNA hydrolase [Spirochaetaceae bacterium]|jgi:PTH1 family peptidyl-tRNA hydrolase|nr:aminoacyl-tRNA hydrolase [Spirochaetaceae bacterium]